MRAADHQLLQRLFVVEMGRQGEPGIAHDNEGSGYGFRTVLAEEPLAIALPSACRMVRPPR
jgi:branched-chain amino acid transport system substrate-binding protein